MTMCNVFLTESQAVLMTDTLEYLQGGTPLRLGPCKAELAVNGRFAIGGQGLSAVADEARAVLAYCEGVDDAAELARELLSGVWSAELRLGDVQRIVVAGFDRANAVRGVVIERREGAGDTVTRTLPQGATLLPSPGDAASLPSAWPDERLVRLATWQTEMAPRFGLPIAVGGVIHKTTIAAEGAAQEILCLSPDYAELVCRLGGDMLAAEVDAWRAAPASVSGALYHAR